MEWTFILTSNQPSCYLITHERQRHSPESFFHVTWWIKLVLRLNSPADKNANMFKFWWSVYFFFDFLVLGSKSIPNKSPPFLSDLSSSSFSEPVTCWGGGGGGGRSLPGVSLSSHNWEQCDCLLVTLIQNRDLLLSATDLGHRSVLNEVIWLLSCCGRWQDWTKTQGEVFVQEHEVVVISKPFKVKLQVQHYEKAFGQFFKGKFVARGRMNFGRSSLLWGCCLIRIVLFVRQLINSS